MKQVSHVTPKLTKPKYTGILERERLYKILDISRKLPVIWITGPAGSGKTTLISSFLESRKIPCLWYSIDEGDSDIATFFYYMGMAAQTVCTGKKKPLPLLTPEYLLGVPAFTKRYFEELCNRLKKPSAIVFDNYQSAVDYSILHDVMATGLSVIPKDITLIFLSRSEPPAALSHIRFSNPQSMIGWNELRLTHEEAGEMISMKHLNESEKIVCDLHRKSDGWFAGLVLMLAGNMGQDRNLHTLRKQTPQEIFDYFAQEIFNRADKGIQDFLLKTVFLPGRTPKMAEELTGQKQAAHVLMELSRENYFTSKRIDREHSFEFHPLFKEFLIKKAGETFAAPEILKIKKKAASVLEANGRHEAAVALYHETGDMENLIHIILSQAQLLLEQGRHRVLMQWIQLIPEEIRNKTPWLLYWLGLSSMPFRPKESTMHFEKAFSLFDVRKDAAGVFISWSGIVYSIVYGFWEYMRLDPWIEKIDYLLRKYPAFPLKEIEARFISSVITALVFRKPDHKDIEAWIERGLNLSEKIDDQAIKFDILAIVFYCRLFTGDLKNTLPSLAFFHRVLQSPADVPFVLIPLLKHLLGVYFWLTGQFKEALKTAEEALKSADETGVHISDDSLCVHAAASAMGKGDMKMAMLYIDKIRQDPFLNGSSKAMYHLNLAWHALLENKFEYALFQAESSLKSSSEVGYVHIEILAHFGISLAMHGLGRRDKAARHLALFQDMGMKIRGKILEFMGLLANVYFAMGRGDDVSASDNLRKAMVIGRDNGYVNYEFWIPSMMTKLCMTALEEGIEVEYVQDLIRKRNLTPEQPPLHIEQWPWHIKVLTLGKFEIIRDGNPVVFPRKAQKKPLLLLKTLLSLGGKEIKEDRLTDLLWPDAEGDAAHSSFTTTFSRLRTLLGSNSSLKIHEGKLIIDAGCCWVDAWAFEKLYEDAVTLWRSSRGDDFKKAVSLAEKAVLLYKGQFLPHDSEYIWTASYRERLRDKFLRLVTEAGEYLQESGQYEEAEGFYRRGLDVDELAEELYRRLMLCYVKTGRKTKAVKLYQCCRDTLQGILGIDPSKKTEEIYQGIIKGK